jgi:hypothetical protein
MRTTEWRKEEEEEEEIKFASFPPLPALSFRPFQQTSGKSLRGSISHISETEHADAAYTPLVSSARNGNLEVPVYFWKAKEVHTLGKNGKKMDIVCK